MAFFALLLRFTRSKITALGWLLLQPAGSKINPLKTRLTNTTLAALIGFYSGYAGAEILPTDTADTQVYTVNAVPVVDIAKPTASGVSNNQFNDFDVYSAGMVINNSLIDGSSSLVGDLSANANFTSKSARIILNQVVTTNTSDINGMTEIFGDDASYILANPNGISCNGCGFIRTPTALDDNGTSLSEVLLTTGTATVDIGNTPMTITVDANSSASIVIGGGGLDATQVDVTTLFTRKAQIQGVIDAANQLRLLVGGGTLEIEKNVAPEDRTLTTTQSDDGAVSVAIDATVAGAMNAGQIFIQATEDGVGVTLDSNLISTSGDIEITAEGEIRYKNANANGDIAISTDGAGSTITAGGDSVATGDITWNLGGDGLLDASGDIAFSAGGTIEFNCSDPICQLTSEDNIQFDADKFLSDARLATSTGSDLVINAGVVNAKHISSGDDLHISASAGDIEAGQITAANNINLVTGQAGARIETSSITATNGSIYWLLNGAAQLASTGALSAAGNIQFEYALSLSCELNGDTSLALNAQQLITQADIFTSVGRDITINADLDTDTDIGSGGHLVINARGGDINTRGLLQAVQDIELSSAAGHRLILDGGVISGGNLGIFGDGTYIHDSVGLFDIGGEWIVDTFGLTNSGTLTLTDFKDRTFFVKELNNYGLIQSNSSLELHVDDLLNNSGVITSLEGVIQIKHSQEGQLTIEVNNSGIISSTNLSQNQQPDSSLIIDPQSLIEAHVAAILDGEQLSAQDLTESIESANQRAIADLTVDTNILGAVEIHAQSLDNTSSGSITGSQILLDVQQMINSGGLIVAGSNLSISGDSVSNQNDGGRFGIIAAHDNIDITLSDQLTNSGIIEATDVQIDAPTQLNENSGFVVDSLSGLTLDAENFVEAIGQLAWFSAGLDSGPYYQTIQGDSTDSLVNSELSLLTDGFLTAAGADLAAVPIVGDDVYISELIAHTVRDSGGLPFVTEDRSNLLQLGSLYDNTLRFMTQSGLAFGETPTSQQLQQLETPVLVFGQQTLANSQIVYTPRLIMPQSGPDNYQLQAQQLFTQIIAYNELLIRGERVANSASLVGGNRLIIETINLTQTTTERNWYVDADGQVQYLSARIESPELVLSLSGDYVQEGGLIVSQGQVFIDAETVEVSGVEVNGRSAIAEINTEDALIILAHERARYGHDSALTSGAQTILQGGGGLVFDGSLRAAGDISLLAEGQVEITGADIYTTSKSANLSVLADAGSIGVNDSRLRVNGNISFQAADNILLSRSSLEAYRSVEDENKDQLILVDENGEINPAGGNIFSIAGGDFVNEGNLQADGDIVIAARDITNTRLMPELEDSKSVTDVSGGYKKLIKLTSGGRQVLDTGNLVAGGDIFLNAERDIIDTAGRYNAGGDINLLAKRDISQNALSWQETEKLSEAYTRTYERGKSGEKYSRTYRYDIGYNSNIKAVTGSLTALGSVNIQADQDLSLFGTDLEAGDDIRLSGRDITLQAIETGVEKYRNIGRTITRSRTVRHEVADLNAGGNIVIQAEADLTTYGSLIDAGEDENGNIFINAKGDTNLLGVNNEDYAYYQRTKKKSFGRKKTWISEDYSISAQGTSLSAGGSLLINIAADENGDLQKLASADVYFDGSDIRVGANAVIHAGGNVVVSAALEYDFRRRETRKRGFAGLSSKSTGSISREQLLKAAELESHEGDLNLLSDGNISITASNLNSGRDINFQAYNDVSIIAGEQTKQRDDWSISERFLSGGSLYKLDEIRTGNTTNDHVASELVSGNDISIDASRIQVIGSGLLSGNQINAVTDVGDIEILAVGSSESDYEYEKHISVSLGDALEGLTDIDSIVATEDGRLTIKLASAKYDEVDSQSDAVANQSSYLQAYNGVTLDAAGDILVQGSSLIADAGEDSVGTLSLLSGGNVNIVEARDRLDTTTDETHGSAELSVVVQNQVVEVDNAIEALGDAKDQLKQSRADYRQYKRDLDLIKNELDQLEEAYQNNTPGIDYTDIQELQALIEDAEDDEDWYKTNIAAAVLNITSKTTLLAQTTAAAAQSAATYGFDVGLQLEIDATRSRSNSQQDVSVASYLQGSDILISTGVSNDDESSTTIRGSYLNASNNLTINTGQLDILASKDNFRSTSDSEQENITIAQTIYGSAAGGPTINGSMNRSTTTGQTVSYNNSTLNAANIILVTKGDTNIVGGNVAARERLIVDIGGDLLIESKQNRSTDNSKSTGISGGFGLGQGESDGHMSSVNAGANSGSGRNSSRETLLSSLTSGGTADVSVQGHTQINGAILATVDDEGNDLGNLNLNTSTFGYEDFSNTSYSQDRSAGFNTSVGLNGLQQAGSAAENSITKINTSSLQYSNSSSYTKTKTLATLGQGSIQINDAESSKELTRLNRDLTKTSKQLFSVNRQQGNFSVTVDTRLFTETGREQIREQILLLPENLEKTAFLVLDNIEAAFGLISKLGLSGKQAAAKYTQAIADSIKEELEGLSLEEREQVLQHIGIFFDGTGRDMAEDLKDGSESNVAILSQLYSDVGSDTAKYLEGVGTDFGTYLACSFSGCGGQNRINEAIDFIAESWDKESFISLDIFGFSRGSAEGLALQNKIFNEGIPGVPMDKLMINGMFLFDTVGSTGFPGNDADWNYDYSVSPFVGSIFHATADHEFRGFFDLQSLVYRDRGAPANVVQQGFPGAHSDVGGGYRPSEFGISNELSSIPLVWMYQNATDSGIPLTLLPEKYGISNELNNLYEGYLSDKTAEANIVHGTYIIDPNFLNATKTLSEKYIHDSRYFWEKLTNDRTRTHYYSNGDAPKSTQ